MSGVIVWQISDGHLVATRSSQDATTALGEAWRSWRGWTVTAGGITAQVWRRRAAVRAVERLARGVLIAEAIRAARLDTYRSDLEDRMARDRGWRT